MPHQVGPWTPSHNMPGYHSRPVRQARDVGAPLAVIVVGAILIGLLVVLVAAMSPRMFAIGTIPSALALVIGLSCYMWLDQWEPEPPKLLLYAFVWGGGIATIGTLAVSLLIGLSGLAPALYFYGPVIEAPIVEEGMKGAFLFFMLTGVRRREMRTLVDHLVYAGFVGFGFAFVENLMYFSMAETLEDTAFMAIVRTGFNMFGHAFYTSATAVGIYLGRKQQGSMRQAYFIGGYLVAVLLHALWNGSTMLFGGLGLIIVYVAILTPGFIALVVQGIKARKREGLIITAQLPRMVAEGLVTPQEATWMQALNTRSAMRQQIKGNKEQLARVASLVEAVGELAIIRDRTQGEPSPYEQQEEQYLVQSILAERQTAGPFAPPAPPMGPQQAGPMGQQPGPMGPQQPGPVGPPPPMPPR